MRHILKDFRRQIYKRLIGMRRREPGEFSKRIFIYRNDHLGDFLCSLPFIKAVHDSYAAAGYEIVVGVSAVSASLAQACAFIDKVIIVEQKSVRGTFCKLLGAMKSSMPAQIAINLLS